MATRSSLARAEVRGWCSPTRMGRSVRPEGTGGSGRNWGRGLVGATGGGGEGGRGSHHHLQALQGLHRHLVVLPGPGLCRRRRGVVVGHPAIMAVPDLVALVWYREAWRGARRSPWREMCSVVGHVGLLVNWPSLRLASRISRGFSQD